MTADTARGYWETARNFAAVRSTDLEAEIALHRPVGHHCPAAGIVCVSFDTVGCDGLRRPAFTRPSDAVTCDPVRSGRLLQTSTIAPEGTRASWSAVNVAVPSAVIAEANE